MEVELIGSLVAFPLIGLLAIQCCVRLRPWSERSWLWWTLGCALTARLGAAFAFQEIAALRFFHEDAAAIDHFGPLLARSLTDGGQATQVSGGPIKGYMHLAIAVYVVFGDYPANAALFNGVVSTINVFLVYLLAVRFFHPRVARTAALFAAFLPSLLIYGAMAVKDSAVIFLILLALLLCVELRRRPRPGPFLVLLAAVGLLYPLRFYAAYLVAFAAVAAWLTSQADGTRLPRSARLLVLLACAGMLWLGGLSQVAGELSETHSLEALSYAREAAANHGHSGFNRGTDISTPLRALTFLPIGFCNVVLGPFPWRLDRSRQLFVLPEVLFWWWWFPAIIRGLVFSARRCFIALSPVLIFSGSLAALYSLVLGEMGTAVRQRGQFFLLLFIFGALGRLQVLCRRQGVDENLLLLPEHRLAAHGSEAAAPVTLPAARLPPAPRSGPVLSPPRLVVCALCQGKGRVHLTKELRQATQVKRPCVVCRGKGCVVVERPSSLPIAPGRPRPAEAVATSPADAE